jgi:hypothetical protein
MGSVAFLIRVGAGWCDSVLVAVGPVPPLRKANSGSSADGSFLSALLDTLVLKAHRNPVEGVMDARDATPLDVEIEDDDRIVVLRQAAQMNFDEAALEKDMLEHEVGDNSWMALCT